MIEIHPSAAIETDRLGDGVKIGAHVFVARGATVEDGVSLHANVVVMGDVTIGAGTEVFPGAVLGKAPAQHPVLSRTPVGGGPTRLGSGCSVGAHAVVYEGVDVGPETLVGDFASIREGCRIGAHCVVGRFVSVHPDCEVGDGSRIVDHAHLATATRVGRDCFISVHVSTASDPALGRLPYAAERVRGPVFGDRVSVGASATILQGVCIGDDATVASGAIVTRDVAAGSVVRGAPARPIEDRGP